MKFYRELCITVIIILALASEAFCVEVGGGSKMSIGPDSTIRGSFQADGTGASTTMTSGGALYGFEENHFDQDNKGKRAEIFLNVTGASDGSIGYKASFVPTEGTLATDEAAVSATENVKIPAADSIVLHTAAKGIGSNTTGVNLTVTKVGSTKASFTGLATSMATALKATSEVQGKVVGVVNGTAWYGGSSIGGPYTAITIRDSNGRKVEGSLDILASDVSGTGILKGVTIFSVDAARNETIGGAAGASWDGGIINVARGTYYENVVIDTGVTVKGAGAGKTVVDGRQADSVVRIGSGKTVSMSGMTVQNGSANNGGGFTNEGTLRLSGIAITGNRAWTLGTGYGQGGGIFNYGTAILDKVTISGNLAGQGGGVYSEGTLKISNSKISENSALSDYGKGGGISAVGRTYMDKSEVFGNYASGGGGGISCVGTTFINDSKISKNSAREFGAGIDCESGTLTVSRSTISGNTGGERGGGINGEGSQLTVSKSTISGNTAKDGGGIYTSCKTDVTGTTVSGNIGCGIYNSGSSLNVTDSTVSGNSGGMLTSGVMSPGMLIITRSKITNNIGGSVVGGIACFSSGIITDSTISGNIGGEAGGVYSYGILSISNSKVTGNYGTSVAGGVYSLGGLDLIGSTVSGNAVGWCGSAGGVYCNSMTTITGSTISGNTGGQYAGGVASDGTLAVTKSKITGNKGCGGSGGVYGKSKVTISDSTVSENTGSFAGGINSEGTLDITKSLVSKNSGSYGGGIFALKTTNVTGSTITNNYASANGGGICFGGYPGVPGSGVMSVKNSTVSGNTAGQSGGAVYNAYQLNINGTTQVTGNKASSGYGGGIYSTGTVAFNGTKAKVTKNKAFLPQSTGTWYQGYGVYAASAPGEDAGFNNAVQVTGNTKA